MISRRDLLILGAAAATNSLVPRNALAQATSTLVEAAKAAGQSRVVMIGGGAGAYGKLMNELFFQPFTKETGIEVTTVQIGYGEAIPRLKAMAQVNNIEWDTMSLPFELALSSDFKPYFEDFGKTCEELPAVGMHGIEGSCFGTAVLWDPGGSVLTYVEREFPNGGPTNWSEFWDVDRFPGPRSLPNVGTPWEVLIAALVADGVARDKIFPLDLDRAFAKLDQLRPHISAWWTSGDQSQQLFRTGEVAASMLWSGRASSLKAEGVPIRFVWDGAMFVADVYGVLKGAANPLAAKSLLNFMYARPEAHAAFIEKMHYALPNKNAAALLDPDAASTLVTAPDNFSKVIKMDPDWLGANRDAVLQRWTTWISG
ncbi:extracellular solute-binding protein [Mesorhizobium sp. ORM16]|uniref:extracellular solute-binding protein n=1 Tax=Mesorhizobium sp. ORM16 TaxID=3376989 RepID=UPI0038576EB6